MPMCELCSSSFCAEKAVFTPGSCSLLPSLACHGPTSLPMSVIKLLLLLKTEGCTPSQSSAGGHRLLLFSVPWCVWLWQSCACPCLSCGCGAASQSPCQCPVAAGLRGASSKSRQCRQLCRGLPRTWRSLHPQGLTLASATCAGQSLGLNPDPRLLPRGLSMLEAEMQPGSQRLLLK